jgi:hypothetical protein
MAENNQSPSSPAVESYPVPSKFRVWDGKNEEMHLPPHDFVICVDGAVGKRDDGIPWHPPNLTAEFYTGYTDLEDELIYEGDIVEAMDNYSDHAGPVAVRWEIAYEEFVAGREWFLETFCKMNEVRVIGSVHEDSDLLEGAG